MGRISAWGAGELLRGEAYTLPQGPGLSEGRDSEGFTLLGTALWEELLFDWLALVPTPCSTRVQLGVSALLEPAGESQFSHTWKFSKQSLSSCLFEMSDGESIYTRETGRH